MTHEKSVRETDEDYLAYIKSQPCLVWNNECIGDITAHHTITVGAGGKDYLAIPLCMRHHNDVHSMGLMTFQELYNIDFNKEIIRLLIGYIQKINREYPDKWFKKGQMSVKRKNKSGCCCIIDDNDGVISACGAHENWRDERTGKMRKAIERALADEESGDGWGPDITVCEYLRKAIA